MHLHLPKPLHGWREFVGEVGIIVLGVLIALGAEQVVERIHERSRIDQLRSALRAELADSRARWEDMRAGDECELKRLDALEQWLAAAPVGSRLPNAFNPMLFSNGSRAAARIPEHGCFAFGCLGSLRAQFMALDGVSWVQSGEVENALDR